MPKRRAVGRPTKWRSEMETPVRVEPFQHKTEAGAGIFCKIVFHLVNEGLPKSYLST